ncbi:HotDog domain-containing protein [Diaporthe sp. PMI_573]|nr:HotDog domain-containing protein [Diaporthaceae sp. PMI_573]
MTGRPNPWATCRSADLVASSCRARWCAAPGLRMPTASQTRWLGTTVPRPTDGVFRGLTDGRLPTPWIEAFRKQQEQQKQQQDKQRTAAREAGPQERDLSPRRMSDSYHRVVLPLGQDPWLSDTYINSSGHIRLGTIFMDLDALSGVIVYKHTGPGVTTVTAALDRITIAHPLTEICDLEYSGQVTYASGRSSVEITCRVARARPEGEPTRPEDELLTCTFTMVALDPDTKKPVNVPALLCDTPEEEAAFKAGEAKSLAKKKMSKTSLLATEPNDPESALIHGIWLRQLRYHDPNDSLRQPANVVPMSTTQLSTAAIMQPQYRNRHQTMIFGGFHLKQTFELAFCCAASFAHARPTFISADPCTFRNPVPVGSVLYLRATIAYTDPPLLEEGGSEPQHRDPKQPVTRVHVRVDSKVRDVEHDTTTKPTGQFNYTFSVPKDVKVMPHTYQEYMMYIDARRRVKLGDIQTRQERSNSTQEQRQLAEDANLTE